MQITAGGIYSLKSVFGVKPYYAVPLPITGEKVKFILYSQLSDKRFGQGAFQCSSEDFGYYFRRNAHMGDRQLISGPYGKFETFDQFIVRLIQRV